MDFELEDLTWAVRHGEAETTVELVEEGLREGTAPRAVLDAMITGIQALGELFKDGQVFLPEVLISVRALNRGLPLLEPHLKGEAAEAKGTVVLGSITGDIHDIGKNLVGMMLAGNGYHIVDIGIDVRADKFLAAVEENRPQIVAMSGLLTTTIPHFETVIGELDKSGLRRDLKIMVGGAPVTPDYARDVGADGYADDCVTAVDEANRLLQILAETG